MLTKTFSDFFVLFTLFVTYANARDGCNTVKIPVRQQLVKYFEQPCLAPTTMLPTFKVT